MSGHSKWNNIKIRKGKSDAVRGKIFTKVGRELAVAVKCGGPDPSSNSRLRDAIAKAKQNNMPNDNITRSIKKASGELNSINFEECQYEGYGIGGSAVMVKCLTDNKNRTASEVRHAFDKHGGSLGANGCVSYLFENKGIIVLSKHKKFSDDEVMDFILEADSEDMNIANEEYEVMTSPSKLTSVKECLETKGLVVLSANKVWVPQNSVNLDAAQLATFLKMIDYLEDNDDVQEVIHNVLLPETEEE